MRAALILTLMAGPAAAELTMCNDTDTLTTVAVGYSKDDNWISEGWWRLEAGQCHTVIKGDLPKRYYYWRATKSSGPVVDGKYKFCTHPEPFTIVGDTDCDTRGYNREGFSEVDIGKSKSYTLTVNTTGETPDQKSAEQPSVADTGPTEDLGPGTFGEPYSVTARFRGCWASAEVIECEFQVEDWMYVVSEEGPTDESLFSALDVFSDGIRLQVSGDLISYSGSRAEVMIRDIEAAPPAPREPSVSANGLMEHMQGFWDSDAGDGYAWIVEGNFLREIYDANIMRESYFEIHDTCAASNGQGPVIIAYPEPDEGEGPSCYIVTETAQRHLAVRDVIEGRSYSFSYSQ